MSHDLQDILTKLETKAEPSPNSFLNEHSYFLAIESAFNMVIITDTKGVIQYANPAVSRITGYSREEVIGKTPRLWGGQMPKDYYSELWETITSGKAFDGEITNRRKNSDSYIAKITISPIRDKGQITGFIGTEEDITLQRELIKEKEEFISMASHQLRTPLGSMKWSLELLREKPTGIEKELEDLANTNQGMIDMVNKLLAVMRIKDNRLEAKKEDVCLNDVVRQAVKNFAERIKEKNLKITVSLPDTEVRAMTDGALLLEIISNLIDNSIKYSVSGKFITVGLAMNKYSWQVTVADEGIGIPPEDLPNIADKYFRSRNAASVSGTGLGLYIVNTYVQNMKGSIDIKSVLGKGTEITCTFPV